MMAAQKFGLELIEALGLKGKAVQSIDLRCAIDEVVTVTVTYYPDDALRSILPTLKTLVLVEKEMQR